MSPNLPPKRAVPACQHCGAEFARRVLRSGTVIWKCGSWGWEYKGEKKGEQSSKCRITQLEAERDRYARRFTDYGDKLREWQEFTGYASPSVCGRNLDALRAEVEQLRSADEPVEVT